MRPLICHAACLKALLLAMTSTAAAAPRPLISYFKPMPIVEKLSSTVWGASVVGARDPGNGLEDNGSDGGVGSGAQANYYWDGKIVKGEDGKYHLYASRWAHAGGFGPPSGASGTGWQSSVPIQAVSDDIMGPYVVQGECYSRNQEGNDKGHNTTALVAPAGAAPYTLSVGEIVAGQMFSSSSANGPWTLLGPTKTNDNGHNGCGTLSSNFTFTVGPDQRFWATSRNGCIMRSDQVLGSYEVETDSVLPNLENNDNTNAEDEVIWYSGGYFHVVYNYWNVQRAYHIMSKDGISRWMSTGLAYQAVQTPANANSNWLRYTDGTVNQWHNMERPGVYQENGHVTHFTFAVTDVDKNTSAVNSGRSKILVVPFDGVQFDCDNGDAASCAEAAGGRGGTGSGGYAGVDAGAAGSGAIGGRSAGAAGGSAGSAEGGTMGFPAGAAGRAGRDGGAGSAGTMRGEGGRASTAGSGGESATSAGNGGTLAAAGATFGGDGARGTTGAGGKLVASGGVPGEGAGRTGAAGTDHSSRSPSANNGGCACGISVAGGRRTTAALLALAALIGARRRRSLAQA